MRSTTSVVAAIALVAFAMPALAQNSNTSPDTVAKAAPAPTTDSMPAKAAAPRRNRR